MNRSSLLVVLACLALGPGVAQAARRFKVTVDSVPQGATIYLEDRAAGPQGTTPHAFDLEAGSYTFILEADGYVALTKTVEVKRAATFNFTMEPLPPPSVLTIKATSGAEAQGATVRVNGKEAGKVPVTMQLQAGRYMVEVTKEGHETWSEWIELQSNEKRTVEVSLVRSASGLGALLVSSNITGAEVFVDGKRVDTAPALLEKLAPGKRTVEVRAPGYLIRREEVSVEAGKTTKLALELQPDPKTVAASSGTLQVLASHKEVEVLVDGTSHGMAPAKVEKLAEGTHVVEGRKAGMVTAEQTVSVKKGEVTTVKLTLKEAVPERRTGGIRVISSAPGATVFIDGQLAGKTPLLRHQMDPGPHFVTVRAEGYEEQVQPVEVKAGQIAEVKANLTKVAVQAPASAPAKAEQAKTEPWGVSSYGAHLVDPLSFTADASFGFPYIFEARATTGVFSFPALGLHGGLEFRTFGALSEIGLHGTLRFLRRSFFAMGMLFSFGGGGGPASRNTAYGNLGVLGSVWFKQMVALTGRAYFNFYTDRLCPSSPDASEAPGCHQVGSASSPNELRERQSGTRFLISAIVEVPLGRWVNVFGILEGAPGQGNRKAFMDRFASIMMDEDPAVYFRCGATFKY